MWYMLKALMAYGLNTLMVLSQSSTHCMKEHLHWSLSMSSTLSQVVYSGLLQKQGFNGFKQTALSFTSTESEYLHSVFTAGYPDTSATFVLSPVHTRTLNWLI